METMTKMNDMTHIAGDVDHGIEITHDLTQSAKAKVKLRYQELVITCEIYEVGGELSVHTLCPRCHNALWISGRNKKIDYDPERGLFVEPFTCAWELPDDERSGREFGLGLCNLRMVYDGKVAREA
jgi:hypothetical protein